MRAQGLKTQNQIIAPNVNRDWTPEAVFETNFLVDFAQELGTITVEKYAATCPHHHPSDLDLGTLQTTARPFLIPVSLQFVPQTPRRMLIGMDIGGTIRQPQEMLPMYLTHATGVNLVQQFRAAALTAQQVGKPFMMFETNTASCGGFPGVSDAFAAALWGLDYGLTMAYNNFTGALWHIGGQNVYYNAFTPPPSNQTAFRQWTVGEYRRFIQSHPLFNPCPRADVLHQPCHGRGPRQV